MELLPAIWAIAAVALMAAELFIPGLVVFFFGVGAAAVALLTALVPALRSSVPAQVLIWLASSGAALGLLRRMAARVFRGTQLEPGDDDADAGRTAEVVEEISPDRPGRIRYQGTTWKAESFDEVFGPGQRVMILRKENLTYTVSRPLDGDG